jgi:glutamate--cysteine ligase catalytic subunit
MYADGALRWAIDMRIPFEVQLTRLKQLLAIWKRAKGKERDALRWGDEVG